MAKLTWRGHDPDDYGEGESPPRSMTWAGITFPIGVAVEVTDETMIRKAKGNRFFKVVEEPSTVLITGSGPVPLKPGEYPHPQWREPATEADPADVSFFDDPPGVETPLDFPPDYPPEQEPKRKPGRPRKVTTDGNQ